MLCPHEIKNSVRTISTASASVAERAVALKRVAISLANGIIFARVSRACVRRNLTTFAAVTWHACARKLVSTSGRVATRGSVFARHSARAHKIGTWPDSRLIHDVIHKIFRSSVDDELNARYIFTVSHPFKPREQL